MLKISRAYLDACGYKEGVFEELLIHTTDSQGRPLHHVIHAPNGVGKTTILALLFSIFEPDRRKFLRTEIDRQHKFEHYFLPGRLGVVALELVRPGVNDRPVHHVVGQIFWLSPGSKSEDGEAGLRRFFAFESGPDLSLDTLPFRGLSGTAPLRSLDDFTRWARDMRSNAPFFTTDSLTHWRKHLTSELGIELKVVEVQRRFCASEGGIGKAFLDFKSEQHFLERIFSFIIPSDAAESVVQALESGLAKIRNLPQRRDQLKVLTQLADRFGPFFEAAAALEVAEAGRAEDFKRLGRLHARLKADHAKLDIEHQTLGGEMLIKEQNLQDAHRNERRLLGEILFLERTAADRRVNDAKGQLEKANADLAAASRKVHAARGAHITRQLSSARDQQQAFEEELARIDRDLAPDRARLARAGANLHALLEQLAAEAECDAERCDTEAGEAHREAELQEQADRAATQRASDLKAEVDRLAARLAEHDRERKELERAATLKPGEDALTALARIQRELAAAGDEQAGLQLQDEQRERESRELEGARSTAVADSTRCTEEAGRLTKFGQAGQALETAIRQSEAFLALLAGEERDPYRPDVTDRARSAAARQDEQHRRLSTERATLAEELDFLDAEGVSSVPADVAVVAQALKEAGIADARPAEHYLAQFKPRAEEALTLLRSDPARFSGVFVNRLDRERMASLAKESRLKLKGPVVVSQATLEASSVPATESGVVFGPFSAARLNKQAAADEKARLTTALADKESELATCQAQLNGMRALIDQLRDLHANYLDHRPGDSLARAETLTREKAAADQRAKDALARQQAIAAERKQGSVRLRQVDQEINRLRLAQQSAEQFSRRYANLAESAARIPLASAEQRQHQEQAAKARKEAAQAREKATGKRAEASTLRANAEARRRNKGDYPETDGGAADRAGTLEDLRNHYRLADQALISKRDAQQATIQVRLRDTKEAVLNLETEYRTSYRDLTEVELADFAAVADLVRAIAAAEKHEQACRDGVSRADASLVSAQSATGPLTRKIENAEKNEVRPIEVPEFTGASAEACAGEAVRREQQLQALEARLKTLDREFTGLRDRHAELGGKLSKIEALAKRALGHLHEPHRNELPDFSVAADQLEPEVDQLITRIGEAFSAIAKLDKEAERLFEAVRELIEAESFRRLEPLLADNLRRYAHRTAGADRVVLQARLAERMAVVSSEIENQLRDQNACLDQLRLHVIHADDLLGRAARCSKIPEQAPAYAGERLLKVRRRLRDVSADIVRNQLSIWLDEQALNGRVPSDGAMLAAELLTRVHGRPLDIELLKPKRDAIEPYMPVDRIGVSGGEGVTVAMMLYTVIQKMAMDERADAKSAVSGGFLMLDNTYGTSNLMEHIVLQKTMADALDIQLFVTTCSEDKHVLNMFPTITRLVQGERVLIDGQARYIRVRYADYLLKEADRAA
jgi:hypothetical protein